MAFYYVSPGGVDSGAGTSQGSPWRTFAFAVGHLAAGDTLWVMPGTFVEGLIAGVPSGSSWNNKVRIAARTPGTATLRPSLGQAPYALAFTNFESYIEWDGINVDGTNVQYDTCRVESWLSGAPHHIRIQNCAITGSQLGGDPTPESSHQPQAVFFLASEANRTGANELRNCTVIAALAYNDFCHGMYVSSSDNLIENCDFSRAGGAQLQIYNGYGHDADRNIVRNNKLHDNQHLGIVDGRLQRGWGITASSGFDNQVYNNLVYNLSNTADGSAGISVFVGSRVLIYNNTVYNVQRRGIGLDLNTSACDTDNNIVYQVTVGGSGGNYTDVGSSNTLGTHNLLGTNPLFTNSGAGDFTLQSGSPAINAGATYGIVTTDLNGAVRPVGPAYDIGCYEFGGSGGGPGPDVPAAGSTIVLDSCTGTTDTGWTSHVGEIGAQWQTHPGSSAGLILSNAGRVRGNLAGFDTFHFASGIPITAEYDVSADFRCFSILTDHTYLLWGRMDTSARTGYFVMYNLTPNQVDLWVVNANVYTLLGSYGYALPVSATPTNIRLEIRNATKKVFIDGTERISSTDNSVSITGRCGIGIYAPSSGVADSNTTGIHLDNIKLIDVSTGPDVDPAGGNTFLQDTFTDTPGVSLVNHTGEIGFSGGGVWTLQASTGGSMVISSANRARGNGLSFGNAPTLIAPPTPLTSSYDLTCNFFVFTLIPGNTYSWWIRTGVSARSGYELVYDSVSTWTFNSWNTGFPTTLGTFQLTPSAGAHQLIIRGRIPLKQVFIDAIRYFSVSDESIAVAGRIGVAAFEGGANSTDSTSLQLSDINGVNVGAVVGNPLLTWLPMTAVIQGIRGAALASGYTPRNSGT